MKVVVTFNRPDSSYKFFYEEYAQHPVITGLHDRFVLHPGFLGKEILLEQETSVKIAMNFDTVENFLNFAKENQDLLDQRKVLIEEWCQRASHTFDHQLITDEPTHIDIP
jgi:antibiotic biosynthesis monooxygenase (ABM) superfamily enzyme